MCICTVFLAVHYTFLNVDIFTLAHMRYACFLLLIFHTLYVSADNDEWLKHITTTTRVGANHYSEMVTDEAGNVYISSYVKDSITSNDFVYIVKVSPDGDILWEQGLGSYGRALSITIDSDEQIWVTGYYHRRLTLGNMSISGTGDRAFVAGLKTSGECIQLFGFKEGTVGYNISSNRNNNLLVTGTFNEQMKYGKTTIQTKQRDEGFVAIVDRDGQCSFLSILHATVYDIKSDSNNNFYLTGNFAELFIYQGTELYTDNFRDNDGFLMKIDELGNLEWINQFGKLGDVSKYYTSRDAGTDIAIDRENNIAVAIVQDSTYENKTLHLKVFDNETGNQIKDKKIANNIGAPGSISLEATKGRYYVSFVAEDHCMLDGAYETFQDSFRVYLLSFDDKLNNINTLRSISYSNFMTTESTHSKDGIYFSGYYKQYMEIKKQSLKKSSSKIALFLYKIPF